MRDLEFRELKVGDRIYPSCVDPDFLHILLSDSDNVWTIAATIPKYDTFLILQGSWHLSRRAKLFWYLAARLSDRTCLAVADILEISVGRIFDPAKWTKIAD